jgi:hypothetical protein
MTVIGALHADQIWAQLERHITERRRSRQDTRLQDLLRDTERVAALVTVHHAQVQVPQDNNQGNHLLVVDLSRQTLTTKSLQLLLTLAATRRVSQFLQHIAWGQNNPHHPVIVPQQKQNQISPDTNNSNSNNSNIRSKRPVTIDTRAAPAATPATPEDASSYPCMYMANRVPQLQPRPAQSSSHPKNKKNTPNQPQQPYKMYLHDGTDALQPIHTLWKEIETLSNAIRSGQRRGATGVPFRHVLVVGQGIPMLTLQWIDSVLRSGGSTTTSSCASPPSSTNPTQAITNRLRRLAQAAVTSTSAHTTSQATILSLHCITHATDPHYLLQHVLPTLHPAQTLVVHWALHGTEILDTTTGMASMIQIIKQWILQALLPHVQPHHKHSPTTTATTEVKQPQAAVQPHFTTTGTTNPRAYATTAVPTDTITTNTYNDNDYHDDHNTDDTVLSQHMIFITANETVGAQLNKPQAVFVVPSYTATAQAFTSTTAAVVLPLAICHGWQTAAQPYLQGAHDMDLHVMNASSPRHNMALLLALTDVWHDLQGQSSSPYAHHGGGGGGGVSSGIARVMVPTTTALQGFPNLCAALEAQVCGNTSTTTTSTSSSSSNRTITTTHPKSFQPSALVLNAGLDGIYDRALYQSSHVTNVEFVTALEVGSVGSSASTQQQQDQPWWNQQAGLREHVYAAQDAAMAAVFAQADELAFGYDRILSDPVPVASPLSVSSVQTVGSTTAGTTAAGGEVPDVARGNRPSTLLVCSRLDAFACGQLIALMEHRVAIKAHIWGIDPFARPTAATTGTSLRRQRTQHIQDDLENLLWNTTVSLDNDDDSVEDNNSSATGGGGRTVKNHNMNLSTRTILKQYARIMREKRGVPSTTAATGTTASI